MNSIYNTVFKTTLFLFSIIPYLLSSQSILNESNQTNSNNKINFNLGYHFLSTQDLIYSQMIYDGSSASSFGLNFDRNTKRGSQRISFQFDNIKIKSTPLLTSSALTGQKRKESKATYAKLSYGRNYFLAGNEKWDFSLGGIFEIQIQMTTLNMGFGDEEGYIFTNTISPWVYCKYQINQENFLSASIHIPFMGWVARPEYAAFDNREIQGEQGIDYLYKRGEIVFLNKYQDINFSIAYTKRLSKSTAFNLEYAISYIKFNEPEDIAIFKNNFNIGLSININ